jgi:hypothetical protein
MQLYQLDAVSHPPWWRAVEVLHLLLQEFFHAERQSGFETRLWFI